MSAAVAGGWCLHTPNPNTLPFCRLHVQRYYLDYRDLPEVRHYSISPKRLIDISLSPTAVCLTGHGSVIYTGRLDSACTKI
jgi:hypothetical protein